MGFGAVVRSTPRHVGPAGTGKAIAYKYSQRRLLPTASNKEQLTKVFASFFKKKRFFLFFFEKKNQKTSIYWALRPERSVRLDCQVK
jgi:hypothetical protein